MLGRLKHAMMSMAIVLSIASPALAHTPPPSFASELDLRNVELIDESDVAEPLPMIPASTFDDVARIELSSPSIVDTLEQRTTAMLAPDDARTHQLFASDSAELASWPLASGDENNLNGERKLSLEWRRATEFQALPFVEHATGLIYVRTRWYDAQTGTFLSPDPNGYDDSSNLYSFCGGDPVNRRDPTGESYWEDRVDELNRILIRLYRAQRTVDRINVGDFILTEGAIQAEIERLKRNKPWFAPSDETQPGFVQKAFALLEKWESAPGRARELGQQLWAYKAPVDSPDVRELKEYVGAPTEDRGEKLGRLTGDVTGAILCGAVTVGQFAIEGEVGGKLLDEAVSVVRRVSRGGRLGNAATRQQIAEIAAELEARGWTITGGGGKVMPDGARLKEEYIRGAGSGRLGASYPDITAVKNGRTLRINTIDTYADGITATTREARNAARIRQQRTGDHLVLIPKPKPRKP